MTVSFDSRAVPFCCVEILFLQIGAWREEVLHDGSALPYTARETAGTARFPVIGQCGRHSGLQSWMVFSEPPDGRNNMSRMKGNGLAMGGILELGVWKDRRIRCRNRKIPTVTAGQDADCHDDGRAYGHGQVGTHQGQKPYVGDGSCNGSAGVYVFPEYGRRLACQNVAQNAAAHAGDDSKKDTEKMIFPVTCGDCHIDSRGCEKSQAYGVGQIHHVIVYLGIHVQILAPVHFYGDKKTGNHPEGDDGVGRVQKQVGRRLAD